MDETNGARLVDGLTGLPNRHALEADLAASVAEAKASGRPLSLLLVDLDRFKTINETQGHDEGDRVLQAVARAARERVGAGHPLYRLGGDEFVALLSTHIDEALAVAERLRAGIESSTSVTATVGVAARPASSDGWDATLMLAVADARLGYAKSYDRRNYVVAEQVPGTWETQGMRQARWPSRHAGANSIRPRADWVLDVLTGIPGRREFGFRAEEEIDRAFNTGGPLCVLLVDVDGLAHYNDIAGIDAGDRALRAFARLLDDIARPEHLICRCGNVGDDFAVLAKLVLPEAVALAETIRARSEVELQPLTVSVSVVARPDAGTCTEREMLEAAASRLRMAREGGARNLVANGNG